jgi:2-dehydropantoate 2-reductase
MGTDPIFPLHSENGVRPHFSRIVVVGAGAIGAFYASVLARAGCEVSVVARSDYDAVVREGYRIRSATLGDLSFRPAQVMRAAGEYRGKADYVLCALKDVRGVDRAALIRPALAASSAIVLVQNGIDVEKDIAAALPGHELISAVAYAAVSREAPGHVVHHSGFTRLVLGNYPKGVSAAVGRLASLVKAGGTNVQATEDIVGARWQKCAWNTVFNPISALGGGLGTTEILASEATTQFARQAIDEVCAIAKAAGHPLPDDTAEKHIAGTLRLPNYISSMGQDRLAGRPMETEALIGNAVRIARALGVPAPQLEALYALLLMIEQKGKR